MLGETVLFLEYKDVGLNLGYTVQKVWNFGQINLCQYLNFLIWKRIILDML